MSQAKQAEEPGLKKVAIWIRVSTEDQAKGESPEHHEHRARAYAEIRGWQVVTLYNLAGVSGKAVMAHPEARRMMDDVKAHRITGLIFSKLARLARNTKELLEFAEFFKSQDADLISLEESIDTSTPAGRFFYTVIAGIAAWEREEIAARVAASVPVRAKLGKPLGGAAPFGYLWKEKKLVPHPEEAPIRRLIYELFREHKRLKTVGETLTKRGLRTRRGKRFSDTTLRRLIEDSTAKGEHLANYTRSRGDGKSWDLKPTGEWVTTAVEPLISAELWAECNALLAERTRTRKPPTKRPVNLFAGLVHCTCGGSFRVPSSIPNKYVCNVCHRKIPVVDLERLFQTELERFVLSPEAVAAHLSDGDEVLAGKEGLLTALLGERERLAREAEKLYRLYLADALSVEGFGAKHRPLEERLRQLDEEVPRLQGEIDFLKMSLLNQTDVLSEAHDLYHRFGDLPFEDRRAIVEAIVERITIGGEEIELALAALPPFPKRTAFGQRTPRGSWTSCHVTLRGRKSRPGFPADPKTLGEHLRRVRLDRVLWQKHVAREIGCSKASLLNWEKGRAEPELRFLPAILRYLAYDPRPEPATFGGRIRAAREAAGLSERELARRLGLDPGTLAAWERDEVCRPYPRIRRVFERWLVSVGAERTAYRISNSAAGTCSLPLPFGSQVPSEREEPPADSGGQGGYARIRIW